MTLRHLEIFVAVAECGKMSEAANKLYIAQSSVSQVISEIERHYDVRLFERYAKTLHLTAVGEEMLHFARHIVTLYNDMDQHMHHSAQATRIRVGATMTIGACLISDIVKAFNSVYPNAWVEVMVRNTSNVERRVLNSELDIALVEGQVKHPNLVTRSFLTDQLVLVVGRTHPFYERNSVDFSEVEGEPFIFRETGSGTRKMTEEVLFNYGINVREAWMCNNSEAMKNAVINNHGIAFMPELLVKKECLEGSLRQVPIRGVTIQREYSLIHHKNKYFTNELKAFVKTCESFQNLQHSTPV